MKGWHSLACLGLLCVGSVFVVNCDSGTSPVAPEMTTLRITANPTTITSSGSSEIRVTATRTQSGTPVLTGTEIYFTTTLGSIDEVGLTDSNGVARATLKANGHSGPANINASSGTAASNEITVTIGDSDLQAKFEATGSGLTVTFNNMSDGSPTSHFWEFGDGNTSSEREPVHTYDSGGTYRVTLTIKDATGEDSLTKVVEVDEKPEAAFGFTTSGLIAVFADESAGGPESWLWDFGEGGEDSTEQHPSHTYGEAGTYLVRLTATNTAGSDTTTRSVSVSEEVQPPMAEFEPMVSGLMVIFNDMTTGGAPTSWSWDFDDGSSSGEQNPTHTFSAAGTYTVTLSVANSAGSDSHSEFVTVEEQAP